MRGISKKREQLGEEQWAEYQRQRKNRKAKNYKRRGGLLYSFRVSQSRRSRKEKLISYKGGKCERCGFSESIPDCFDFHHRNPDEKEFGIAETGVSLEKAKTEVDKCELVCKNCHAKIHWEKMQDQIRKQLERLEIERLP